MSSSGLIYAFIVGAWAVYLVPMWLRREDELNKARQTQRYTTAIKVLSHTDSFERRYGAAADQAEARDEQQARELPLAVGQSGSAPAAGQGALDRVKAKDRERAAAGAPSGAQAAASASTSTSTAGSAAPVAKAAKSAPRAKAAFAAESAASARRNAVSAKVGSAVSAKVEAGKPGVWTPRPAPTAAPASPSPSSAGLGPRSGLRARRRRVVGFLFALTSLGAIVSADLGMSYVWAMLLPAAALTAFIVWVRKDERARAAERARRRAAAARAARETERRESEQRRERDEIERLEREELARRSAVARRRTAAARSRADRRTTPGALPDQGDLPRAANG